MKDASKYIPLLDSLIKDCARKCSTIYCSRDLITIKSRIEHEGLSFLTITLPNFGDDFFTSLEKGFVDSSLFVGWRKRGCLPAFLQGFTNQVFDRSNGGKFAEPLHETEVVQSIRQICYFVKKINLTCSEERISDAYSSYKAIEDDLKRFIFVHEDLSSFKEVARVLTSSIIPSHVGEGDLLPHHGPGSTNERVTGNRKYDFKLYSWYAKLDRCFSQGLNLYPSEEHFNCLGLESDRVEPSVRVIHVPKTQKTPRIIAMEPVTMQYTQQAVKDFLVERIESSPLTQGHVNFTDQTVNQRLALSSSKTKRFATIDLSAASDRVHNELVKILFEVNPSFSALVQCTRSKIAVVEGEEIPLTKFASMGSALCFPIEALVFYTICLIGRLRHKGLPTLVSAKTLYSLSRDIYVYGDDIIIPADEVDSIITCLHNFGMRVNTSKSFVKSNFRESCGMDAYKGVEITPIYLRCPIPDRKSAAPILSLVATANLLYKSGYWLTYNHIKDIVEDLVGFVLPTVDETCEGLGWVEYNDVAKYRYNRNLQRQEVLTLVPSISFKKDEIDGVPALLKCLLRLERMHGKSSKEPLYQDRGESLYHSALVQDEKHLSRTPVRGALTLRRRWTLPH